MSVCVSVCVFVCVLGEVGRQTLHNRGKLPPERRVYGVKGQIWVAGSNSGGCGLQDGLPGKTM